MKIGQVYCVTYLVDGRKYFGFSYKSRTRGYEKRFEKHLSGEGSRHIRNLVNSGAQRKDFEIELVFEGEMSKALELEESLAKSSIYPKGLNGNAGLWADTSGYVWINDGEKNKSCSPEELEEFLASGWLRGKLITDDQRSRMLSGSQKSRGKKYINKDGVNTTASESELHRYLEEGWTLGKYVSPEYRQALSKNGKEWNKNSIGKNARTAGYVWINDGERNTRAPKEKAAELLSSGWKKGRIPS